MKQNYLGLLALSAIVAFMLANECTGNIVRDDNCDPDPLRGGCSSYCDGTETFSWWKFLTKTGGLFVFGILANVALEQKSNRDNE